MQMQSAQPNSNTARFTYPNGVMLEFNTENPSSLNRLAETLNAALQSRPIAHTRYDYIDPETYTLIEHFNDAIELIMEDDECANKSKALASSRLSKIRDFLTIISSERLASSLSSIDAQHVKDNLKNYLQKTTGRQYKKSTILMYYQLFNRVVVAAAGKKLIYEVPKILCKYEENKPITMPLDDDQLTQLLNGWIYRDYNQEATNLNHNAESWKFWLIPIGLYTGARLNEICQLSTRDITTDSEGNWIIKINERLSNQSCKTPTSIRDIPVHPALLNMGFIDFVTEQKSRFGNKALLFPEIKYSEMHNFSRAPSRFFSGNKRGEGYFGKLMDEQDRDCPSFRNLRCTFATVLARNGTALSSIALMLGHSDEETEMTLSHYLPVIPSQMKLKILTDGLKYDINMSHIHWSHYKPLMDSQRHRGARGRRSK